MFVMCFALTWIDPNSARTPSRAGKEKLMFTRPMFSLAIALALIGGALALAQVGSMTQKPLSGKDITLTGRIVDLQCFMAEDYPSTDRVASTKTCIRAG